ncbi:MAG TPA: ABC transporter permease [Thermoanaerobaculia bacterium]|nr:ABC transporter permease [Thermoanaerobaculia bacterium]
MKVFRELLFPLAAVVAAFLVGAVLIALVGDSPIRTYELLIGSALTWPDGIGYTLFYATPLIFAGLGVAVAFRCGLLNIGAEGQLTIAAFATAWAGITFAGWPAWLLVPLCFLAAVVSGGAWGAIPGVLKARFGAHEVITTIMMNFIAAALVSYLTQYHYKPQGDAILETAPIGASAHVARLGRFLPGFPERIPLSLAFPLALGVSLLVYLFLWRTRWGYEIRATGASPAAAAYGGISTRRQIVLAMAVSGGLAGMVAIGEVMGYRYRYYDGFSAGYGFTAIAVALLGRSHPLGVILSALLFGALLRGGLFVDIFTANVSKDLVQVLQGIIILFVAAEAMFRGPFARLAKWRKRA